MKLVRDTFSAGAWMGVRVLSLALWVWLLVRQLPAEDFGWLASVLAVSSVCALIASLGIPYLFFSDVHTLGQHEERWREALGALLAIGPPLAFVGALTLGHWMSGSAPMSMMVVFLLVDVLASAIVQAAGLWGHAVGRLGIAAGLPTMLTVARLAAAGLCLLVAPEGGLDVLGSYLIFHASLVIFIAVVTLFWIARSLPARWSPVRPRAETFARSWQYGAMSGAGLALSELDKPLLSRVMGLQSVGTYAMAYRVCASLAMPATALAAALLPRWAAMAVQRDVGRLTRSVALALLAVAAIGAALALILKSAITALQPGSFGLYAAAWPWMHGLAWLGLVLGLHQVASTAMLAIGRPLTRALLDFGGFGVMAAMMIIVFPVWGSRGVMLVCIFAEAVVAAITTLTFYFILRGDLLAGGDCRD